METDLLLSSARPSPPSADIKLALAGFLLPGRRSLRAAGVLDTVACAATAAGFFAVAAIAQDVFDRGASWGHDWRWLAMLAGAAAVRAGASYLAARLALDGALAGRVAPALPAAPAPHGRSRRLPFWRRPGDGGHRRGGARRRLRGMLRAGAPGGSGGAGDAAPRGVPAELAGRVATGSVPTAPAAQSEHRGDGHRRRRPPPRRGAALSVRLLPRPPARTPNPACPRRRSRRSWAGSGSRRNV